MPKDAKKVMPPAHISSKLVQSNSGKINRGTGVPGQGDGGPSKGKKIR